MNYVGHFYFSKELKVSEHDLGNVCGDFFKGKVETLEVSEDIRKGITFHRTLDRITDSTNAFKEAKAKLKELRPYDGIVLDMYYDHFFSTLWDNLKETKLEEKSEEFYLLLESKRIYIPSTFHKRISYMISENWFIKYREIEFIERVLRGISERTSRGIKYEKAIEILKEDYEFFESNFYSLIKEIEERLD